MCKRIVRDLPALYYMCKKAIKEDDERTKKNLKSLKTT